MTTTQLDIRAPVPSIIGSPLWLNMDPALRECFEQWEERLKVADAALRNADEALLFAKRGREATNARLAQVRAELAVCWVLHVQPRALEKTKEVVYGQIRQLERKASELNRELDWY